MSASIWNPTSALPVGRVWDVTEFPWLADSTGENDCTDAVNACITAAPEKTQIKFPSGGIFKFNLSSVGAQVVISKSLYVIATGAIFNITATASPVDWNEERHNAVFRLDQIDGFAWEGGTVNGGRDNDIVPMVGFIIGHGCKNVLINNIIVNDLDHNNGSIGFDAVLPDGITNVAQENITITNCGFVRCYYGAFLRGSINGLLIKNCWGKDFDLQNPQSGYSRLGLAQYGGVSIGIYGFDGVSTSVTGHQKGVRIVDNNFDGMTQGPVAYNFESNTYTGSSTYACEDIIFSGNIIRRALTGIHCNGWEQAEIVGNSIRRLALANTDDYDGVARIDDTALMNGSGIEISTAGRRLSAVGNNILSYWPRNGATDYSGGFTGIDIGATSNSTETATTGVVSSNQISGCYFGIHPTGNVLAHIEGNRIDSCFKFFSNDTTPQNAGNFAEGTFKGNTIRLDGYSGIKIGGVFRGAWHVTDNTIVGDSATLYDYAVQMIPSAKTASFTDNSIINASEGLYVLQSGSTTFVEQNRFINVSFALEIIKNSGSTLHVRNNFMGSSNTAILFSGADSHGTYYADNNNLLSGNWVSDGAAVIPSQLGYRSSNPNGLNTYSVGCSFAASAPTSGGFIGWVCTAQPNTFKTFGLIS